MKTLENRNHPYILLACLFFAIMLAISYQNKIKKLASASDFENERNPIEKVVEITTHQIVLNSDFYQSLNPFKRRHFKSFQAGFWSFL